MINYSTTNSNLKRCICNYSKKICKGLNRPEMKFVCDMTYGMFASGSSMLSEIARNLNEKIPLIKTVNRLSRNLDFLLTMAIGYISKLSDKDNTMILRLELIADSKRLFGVSDFLYYSITDGIFEILKYTKRGIAEHLRPPINDGQLCFVDWVA